jgi:hypothetical protein
MQLQQLLRPIQGGTFRFARTFLNENPDLLQKYVSTGVNVVGLVLVPLNSFMKHLLLVQKIDPDTVPGEKARRALQDAMNHSFDIDHAKEYDDDFDTKWVTRKFEEARKALHTLNLTKEKFKELTDLNKLPGGFVSSRYPTADEEQEFFNSGGATRLGPFPISEKKELPLDTKEGRAAYRMKVLKDAQSRLTGVAQKVTKEVDSFDPITDLRNAVKAIEEAVGLEKKETPKVVIKPSKRKVNKKVVNKKIIPVGRRTLSGRTELAEKLVKNMVAKGLVSDTPEAMAAQMTELANWDDKAFESMTRVLERHFPKKDPKDKFKGNFRRVTDVKDE